MNTEESGTVTTVALLERLKTEMPEVWGQAQVLGNWVWLEFNVPPLKEIREKLKEMGFHWNSARHCWQHPCGNHRLHSRGDPKAVYPVTTASEFDPDGTMREKPSKPRVPMSKEYKVIALRECPLPDTLHTCDTPDKAVDYWHLNIATIPHFDPERECMAVLMLNTRRRVKGHQLLTIGTMDTILVSPRETFRAAIIAAASAVILMHNHPSGDAGPSEADIKVTRDLIRAGQLIKIEVLDHVIVGHGAWTSLRQCGYFYS